jgi:transposase-like protein
MKRVQRYKCKGCSFVDYTVKIKLYIHFISNTGILNSSLS